MHLVTPLAAGVTGAENGIAEIYLRGTTSAGWYWLDFEKTTAPITTGLVALDSHGGAVIYVQELCNVVVKNVGGAVVREFVAGVRDDSVEVQSPSFNGVAYGQSGTFPDSQTTLSAVLDRWVDTNGDIDWRVGLPGGETATIQDAVAASYGLVINVQAHGAIGDGVANDTNAINSAISAAQATGTGNAIVYFPPGTYRTSGGHATAVSLIGAGSHATVIVLDNAAALRTFQTMDLTYGYQVIAHMRLTAASSTPGASVLRIGTGSKLVLHDLDLDGTNFASHICNVTGGSGSTVDVLCNGCIFRLSSTGRAWFASSTGTVRRAVFRDCKFITPATFTAGSVVLGRGLWFFACLFENDATTTGAYYCIETSHSSGLLHINGCEFMNAAGATVTAMHLGSYSDTAYYDEVDNLFGSTVIAYSYTVTSGARGSNVRLRSREQRSLFIADNTAAPNLPIDQYGMIVLSSNLATTAIVFQATARPPDGSRGTIVVVRTAAAGTVQAGSNFLNPAATAAYGSGAAYLWEYRSATPASTPRMALIVDGRNLGAAV